MNIDEIRQKKLQELMEQQQEAAQEELQLKKQISILEQNLKRHMTKEAYSRYANLKLGHEEFSVQVLVLLNQAIETGKLQMIDDHDFKDLLTRIQKKKTDFNIKRK